MVWPALVVVLVGLVRGPVSVGSDNLSLLTGTLKTMQRAACDDELVSLACPWGTSITIQVAQYGKMNSVGHTCQIDRPQSQPVAVEIVGPEKCVWPNSMQYSLLQTVVEACQKKPKCKFSTQPKSGLPDPCPLARKFVEVAFKCRPSEFRIRSVCEDDVIRLSCNPHSRVVIYEAQYGRNAYEPLTCPQPQGVHNRTCMATYSTETVMKLCHGKRRCDVVANSQNFGTPCKANARTFLKIVYACVPLGVLIEKYESAAEKDEILQSGPPTDQELERLYDDKDGVGEKWGEPSVVPPAPALANPALNYPEGYDDGSRNTEDEKRSYKQSEDEIDNKTHFMVYIGIGVLIFVILIILLVGVRFHIMRRSSRKSKTDDMFTTDVPNMFNDAVSDIDNDIDVSHISGTFYEHPDMILYKDVPGTRGSIRAMRPLSTIYPCSSTNMYGNVDYVPTSSSGNERFRKEGDVDRDVVMSPKTLARYSDSQFYYG